MNIDEAVAEAIKQSTLIDALTWICIWESERIVKQVRNNLGSGSNGAGWDTCFKVCIERTMAAYK